MAGTHDFFSGTQDVPEQVKAAEELKASQDANSFKANDMHSETPDFFKEEPKTEKSEENTESIKETSNDPVSDVETPVKVESEASEVAEEKKEEIKEAIKELMASYGENEYKLPADAKLKHKVDKEEVEVSIQELLNNYSGKQSFDKKFTELDKDRQAYKQDLDIVNKYVSEFATKSKENPVEALEFLAQQVGLDPFEYRKQLRSQLLNKYGDYLSMDEDQRAGFETKERLDYLERQRESEIKVRQQQQAQWELEQKYRGLQESHQIDDERRGYLEKELSEVYNAEVTPENMLELHSSLSRLDRVDRALEKIEPSLKEDDQKVLTLESLLRGNPNMSDDDLSELASKLYGNDISKAVENLTKKSPKREQPKPLSYQPKKYSNNNIDFFND